MVLVAYPDVPTPIIFVTIIRDLISVPLYLGEKKYPHALLLAGIVHLLSRYVNISIILLNLS